MADTENYFLAELAAIINATNDQLKWVGGPVGFLNSVRSSLDDGRNKVNDALREGYAGSSNGQINQQLRAALVLDKVKVRGQADQVRINQLVGTGRMLARGGRRAVKLRMRFRNVFSHSASICSLPASQNSFLKPALSQLQPPEWIPHA